MTTHMTCGLAAIPLMTVSVAAQRQPQRYGMQWKYPASALASNVLGAKEPSNVIVTLAAVPWPHSPQYMSTGLHRTCNVWLLPPPLDHVTRCS